MQVILRTSTVTSDVIQRQRFKSDAKVKTSLNVLARAHPEYSCGKVEKVVSDAVYFKKFDPVPVLVHNIDTGKDEIAWEATAKTNVIRPLRKVKSISHSREGFDVMDVTKLLKNILYFNGYSPLMVRSMVERSNKLEGKKYKTSSGVKKVHDGIKTFKVSTTVEYQWNGKKVIAYIDAIRVKKAYAYEASIYAPNETRHKSWFEVGDVFFCGNYLRKVKYMLNTHNAASEVL